MTFWRGVLVVAVLELVALVYFQPGATLAPLVTHAAQPVEIQQVVKKPPMPVPSTAPYVHTSDTTCRREWDRNTPNVDIWHDICTTQELP